MSLDSGLWPVADLGWRGEAVASGLAKYLSMLSSSAAVPNPNLVNELFDDSILIMMSMKSKGVNQHTLVI